MSQPEDLLQPSLTENDDFTGFKNPWNPHSLILATFFAGPFAGGFLLSLNFKRLGMPRKFGKSLLLFILLGLAIYTTVAFLHINGYLEKDNLEHRQISRLAVRVITVAAAFWAATSQRERFRLYDYSGGKAAGAWVPGILAVVAGAAITYLVFIVIYFLLSIYTKAI